MIGRSGCDDLVALAASPGLMIGVCLLGFIGAIPNGAGGQERQGLHGRVIDASSAEPIPFAEIWVVGRGGEVLHQTDATAEGDFSIRVGERLPDTIFLSIEALGYYSIYEGPFGKDDIEDVQVEAALKPMVFAVDGIDVAVDGRVSKLERVGFYQRREHSAGHFMDAKAIEERRGAQSVADLVTAAVPGVSVNSQGEVSLRGMLSLRAAKCGYKVYLDGMLVVPDSNSPEGRIWATQQGIVSPPDLAGIEIYRSPAQVPVQYGGANAGCGVILLWTLSGER